MSVDKIRQALAAAARDHLDVFTVASTLPATKDLRDASRAELGHAIDLLELSDEELRAVVRADVDARLALEEIATRQPAAGGGRN